MTARSVNTRFRAYQLDTAGGSFSYYSDGHFTLVEARYSDANEQSLLQEMKICGVKALSTLHITSWDQDHCAPSQLERILGKLQPSLVEYPGYEPHTESGVESLKIIKTYKQYKKSNAKTVSITPAFIKELDKAKSYGYKNVFYHPKSLDDECANNNSTVKQFRSGSFNVLSLGDVESTHISAGLRRQRTIHSETDIMILAHHGANNGFTTSGFLKHVRPTAAIAISNYGNQFNHPKPEIRALLHKNNIDLFTTKTGDIIVRSIVGHTGSYEILNLKAGSTEVSSSRVFVAKKQKFLNQNTDTIRNRIHHPYRGRKK